MTKDEIREVQARIKSLEIMGFLDAFIYEVLGEALYRYISSGGEYINHLDSVLEHGLSQIEAAVIDENDAGVPDDGEVN